ncbi:hypothetical protein AKJ63_02130 [candidate division MSBL1 archaeon SCGC-AAA259D18]|uniref:Uncharacterized protein n=2 Tax=candidate division MSBL1 TaxID=215777 RepID=A0A133UAY5_9EURY|nr:hypothetical protein AKJ63_02130 [candidate division MSBL1 archaeon SCGC-AAA259D18]KXA91328.1 hypothetical protein AKJ57_01595 [candidate division MSBL1 archaeon SCGC-AAA259A05]
MNDKTQNALRIEKLKISPLILKRNQKLILPQNFHSKQAEIPGHGVKSALLKFQSTSPKLYTFKNFLEEWGRKFP